MSDEYSASPLEQLVPSRLSRWLASALAVSLANVAFQAWNCVVPLTQGQTTGIQQVWQLSGSLLAALILSLCILLDLALLFKAKKHDRIIHHHTNA
jgi:hypothetical protein